LVLATTGSAGRALLIETIVIRAGKSSRAIGVAAVGHDIDDSIGETFHLGPSLIVTVLHDSWRYRICAGRRTDRIADVATAAHVPFAEMASGVAGVVKCAGHRRSRE